MISNSKLSASFSAKSALDALGRDKTSSVSCSIDRIAHRQMLNYDRNVTDFRPIEGH